MTLLRQKLVHRHRLRVTQPDTYGASIWIFLISAAAYAFPASQFTIHKPRNYTKVCHVTTQRRRGCQ